MTKQELARMRISCGLAPEIPPTASEAGYQYYPYAELKYLPQMLPVSDKVIAQLDAPGHVPERTVPIALEPGVQPRHTAIRLAQLASKSFFAIDSVYIDADKATESLSATHVVGAAVTQFKKLHTQGCIIFGQTETERYRDDRLERLHTLLESARTFEMPTLLLTPDTVSYAGYLPGLSVVGAEPLPPQIANSVAQA